MCVGGILFADVVGFSRLKSDEEVIRFFREFLGRVAALSDAAQPGPLVQNSWGDGLYFAFGSVRAAGIYALNLAELVQTTDWAALDLPDMSIRIALHAGPLYSFVDPITRQVSWSGKQVTRAARMEPITPPGSVYASREFAAIAAAQNVSDFRCEPVGRIPLDKKEGLAPVFVVRPATLPGFE